MNRKQIVAFANKNEKVLVCGKGIDYEPLCWYLDCNKIEYKSYEPGIEHQFREKTGVFWIESDENIEQYLTDLRNKRNVELFRLSKTSLRELRCMHVISTTNDPKEAEMLLEAVKENRLDDNVIGNCTYAALMYLKNFYTEEVYQKIYNAVCTVNKERIEKQDKVKVGFLVKHSSEWSAQSIYDKLKEDPRYEVMIFVAPYYVGTQKSIMDNYNNTVRYFVENGYPVKAMYDEEKDVFIQWSDENKCDYMFNLSPSYVWLRKTSCIVKFPLSTLNMYIPYGFYISGFVESQFNQLSHAMFWKTFCESGMHKEMAAIYADMGNENVEFSGYLKMDCYYEETEISSQKIWSIPQGADVSKMKKIIYAPHWSIGESKTKYGNFEKIYNSIYEYAKSTRNEISWIIKPHPRLQSECVVQGLFKTEQEFDEYLEKWNELDNAKAVTSGTYEKIFMSSDGMVLDSISFIAEYMYVHKPMIFLTREDQTVNDFGKAIMETLYKVEGSDFETIKQYIQEIIVENQDSEKEIREKFFQTYLDYYKINGMNAADYILRFL